MAIFYYSVVDTGILGLNIALGIPAFLVGVGLWFDAWLMEEEDDKND